MQKEVIYTRHRPSAFGGRRSGSHSSGKSKKSASQQKKTAHPGDVISAEVVLAQEQTFGPAQPLGGK